MSCSFLADTASGPAVIPCRRQFDFTLLFEELFFRLLPSCIFIPAVAARLVVLLRRPAKARKGTLYAAKLVAIAAFVGLELAFLICICRKGRDRTYLSIPSAALSYIASLALAVASHFEHTRSYRPSFIVDLYLAITLLLRAATTRTYWLMEGGSAISCISLITVFAQIILLALEGVSKRKCFLDQSHEISPEGTAGLLSRSFFTWLNRLLVIGYGRPLETEDLDVDGSLASVKIAVDFSRLQTCKDYGRFGLIGVTFRCLGLYALSPVIPRLCMTGFIFSQPFLASSLLSYLENPSTSSKNSGYGLIGASFLVYVGIAISTGWYWHLCYKCAAKIRGGLVEVIATKMLRLRQEKGVESKVLTLIIGDVHRISTVSAAVHEFWIAPIETSIGVWLLWRQVGPASLAVLAVAASSMVASVYIGKHIGGQQGKWLAATEKRLEATKSMLSSLKAIKMTSAGRRVGQAIEALRVSEFAASKIFRSLLVASVLSSFVTVTLAPVAVFGSYIGSAGANADFNIAKMFSSLILITLISTPLLSLFQVIPSFGAALGCAPRIEEFLRREEVADPKQLTQNPIDLSEDPSEKGSGKFPFTVQEDDRNGDRVESTILSMRGADLGWDDRVLLKNVTLKVTRGQHIVITGPVGCGKSLLLRGILGEVSPKAGSVSLAPVSLGYCDQTAWLENLGVRDNAFRCAPLDSLWHERVADACALRDLVISQPRGGTIGSGGSQISGGEKQRLTLARAITLRPALLILDDTFSAVDRLTKRVIFDRLFGPHGIITELRTTVIQVTQDPYTAQFADVVLTIDKSGQLVPFLFPSKPAEGGSAEEKVAGEIPEGTNEKATSGDASSSEDADYANPASIKDRDVYKAYFRSVGWVHTSIFILGTMSFAVAIRFTDIWVRWWIEDARLQSPERSTGFWLGLYAFLGTLPLLVVCVAVGHLMHKVLPISGVGLHGSLLKTVLNATFVFISRIDSGSIINRFNQDLMLIDLKLPLDLLNTSTYGFIVIVQIILVTITAVYLVAAIPVLLGILWVLSHFYLRTSKRLRQLDLETKSDLHTKVSESYRGIVTIRAHGWETAMREEFREKLDKSQKPLYLLWMVQTWLQFVLNMIVAGLATMVAGVAVATRQNTSAGAAGIAILNIVTLGESLTQLLHSWTSLETSLGAIARIQAFKKDTPVEKEIEDPAMPPPEWPSSGPLILDQVWVSYHPEQESPTWSLCDISIHIRPGERVAVCGRSGSGKSTLLMALLGLVDISKGKIQIDGIDISRVPPEILRSRYSVISQDAFLQGETIREMLDAGGRFSDEAINNVLSECAVLDKVRQCGGLSSSLQDANLSVGQTQAFILARTILQAGSTVGGVVLLDEATSSVDTATEERIANLIFEKLKGKIVISVLHRLEAALRYDKILVLEKGRVAHFGTAAEVTEKSDLFRSTKRSA